MRRIVPPQHPERNLVGIYRRVLPCDWAEAMKVMANLAFPGDVDLREPEDFKVHLVSATEISWIDERYPGHALAMRGKIRENAPTSFFRKVDVDTTGRVEPYPHRSLKIVGPMATSHILDLDRASVGSYLDWVDGRNPTRNPFGYHINFGVVLKGEEQHRVCRALGHIFPTVVTLGPVVVKILGEPDE